MAYTLTATVAGESLMVDLNDVGLLARQNPQLAGA